MKFILGSKYFFYKNEKASNEAIRKKSILQILESLLGFFLFKFSTFSFIHKKYINVIKSIVYQFFSSPISSKLIVSAVLDLGLTLNLIWSKYCGKQIIKTTMTSKATLSIIKMIPTVLHEL
jgi:hypothetical protein